jgi:hypothetical protein
LQEIVAHLVVELLFAHAIVHFHPMRLGLGECLLQVVRAARIGVGDDESPLVEASLWGHAEHPPVTRHDLAGDHQMVEGAVLQQVRRGIDVAESLVDQADDGWDLRNVGNPHRPHLATKEEERARETVEHRRQPPAAMARVDHRKPEVNDIDRAAAHSHPKEREHVERDRQTTRSVVDEGDDGAIERLLLAGEDPVVEAPAVEHRDDDRPEPLDHLGDLLLRHPKPRALDDADGDVVRGGELEVEIPPELAEADRPHGTRRHTFQPARLSRPVTVVGTVAPCDEQLSGHSALWQPRG